MQDKLQSSSILKEVVHIVTTGIQRAEIQRSITVCFMGVSGMGRQKNKISEAVNNAAIFGLDAQFLASQRDE
jgi:hypothetical protein